MGVHGGGGVLEFSLYSWSLMLYLFIGPSVMITDSLPAKMLKMPVLFTSIDRAGKKDSLQLRLTDAGLWKATVFLAPPSLLLFLLLPLFLSFHRPPRVAGGYVGEEGWEFSLENALDVRQRSLAYSLCVLEPGRAMARTVL